MANPSKARIARTANRNTLHSLARKAAANTWAARIAAAHCKLYPTGKAKAQGNG